MEDKPLSLQVYEAIKKDIVSLKYPPGSYLRERELAESLGVSRTPVREAIQRLSQEFWIISGDGKKMQVRPVTAADVREIIQIRNIIEFSAIDWLVNEGEPRVVAGQLDSILNEMKKTTEQYVFTKLDLSSHCLIIKSMQNERIIRFWATIQEEVIRMGLMALRGEYRFKEVINEHEILVNALWKKDANEVKTSMKDHLEKSFASLLAHLDIPEGTDNNRSNGYSGK
ncbi:MAG: GntR family transcriptional regulator [Synergistota bacterium]|nr:GntR family transcriptional regulator [Synergistota bacterium]